MNIELINGTQKNAKDIYFSVHQTMISIIYIVSNSIKRKKGYQDHSLFDIHHAPVNNKAK